jgi:tetratricopeptide (TPR) repeat protein
VLPDITGHFTSLSAHNPSTARKRLDSWKEIAAFFSRDERTVNRWEKELGLPVHRLPGTKGRVYAYTEELSAWVAAPKNARAASPELDSAGQHAPGQPGPESPILTPTPGAQTSFDVASLESPSPLEATPPSAGRYSNTVRLLAAAILGMGIMALVFLFHASASRFASRTSSHAASPSRQASPTRVVLASTPSHDPEAEQLYLKGRYFWNKRTPDDLNKALDYFTQAIVHDPNYAESYVGLADCYNLMREYTLMPSSEAYPRALAAAKKAVELDDQSSEAHASLAFASFFGMWDVATGEREFRRAIDLNPNNPAPHQWYANGLLALQRLPEALAEIDRAQALDPASAAILADKGNILAAAGRQDEALNLLKQMEARDSSFRSPHLYLKYIYLRSRDYPNFLSELRKDALLVHDDSALAIATAAEKGFAAGGARGMFEAILQVQKKFYAQHSLQPTALALTFASLGNKEEALECLKAAYDQRDSSLLFVETYPEFNTLHDEPAYRDLLTKMNLPAQNVPVQVVP